MPFPTNFPDPTFQPSGAETLAVVLHGYSWPKVVSMADPIEVVRKAFSTKGVDIYAPTLPYSNPLDSSGANQIVENLVADLDEIWEKKSYDNVIFIGHSMGGVLLRRVFLAGAPHPPDYSGKDDFRDDLAKSIRETPHGWAAQVKRFVLLAAWDKGWSFSARDAWKYWFWFNVVLGPWGRLLDIIGIEAKPGRTMLDMRRGSPFIVQTRLLWMAYRRWHYITHGLEPLKRHSGTLPEGADPLVVQVLGTIDNFVSPQDQVDNEVDGVDLKRFKNQNSFLLEMPDTDHAGAIDFQGPEGDERKQIFEAALIGVTKPEDMKLEDAKWPPFLTAYKHNRNPAFFDDLPTPIDPKIEHVVFVMHGIRDDGYWTHRIAKAIKEAAEDNAKAIKEAPKDNEKKRAEEADDPLNFDTLLSLTPTYGYFPMGAFIMPWIRRQKVEWFMDQYVDVKARYPNVTMHYVGHSNGTYLAASALKNYKAARFGRIYFAGCVVHPKFDWSGMVDFGRVHRIHNARGAEDYVVALLPKSLEYFTDVGGAGFDGFEPGAADGPEITQSTGYALGDPPGLKGGHSGAIGERHWPEIANFIVNGKKPFTSVEPDDLFAERRHRGLKFLADFRIVIPLAFSLVSLVVLLVLSLLWLPSGHWKWGAFRAFGGWGWALWVVALIAFLALQYSLKRAPSGYKARLSFCLFFVSAIGVANWFFTSLVSQFVEFSKLDASKYSVPDWNSVPGWAEGASFTLVGLLALIRFILTRY